MTGTEVEIKLDIYSPFIGIDCPGFDYCLSIFDFDVLTQRIAVIDRQCNMVLFFTGYKFWFKCLRYRIDNR